MPKKIFDIIPPEKEKTKSFANFPKRPFIKREEKEKFVSSVPESRPMRNEFDNRGEKTKKNKGFKKIIQKSAIFVFLLFLLISSIFLFVSETKIEIWPKTDMITLNKTVEVALNQKQSRPSSWLESGSIPGRIFKDRKSASREFSSSGKVIKEAKAKGVIRVYNTYSTRSQPLLPNTRFVSAEGKLFRSVKRVVIPGQKRLKGKLIAGELDIEVRAAETGEDYNIGPSAFSIPGFLGTPKYTAFYGKSFSPMSNGFKGETAQVLKEDLDKAEKTLTKELEKESGDFIKTALPQGFVLLKGALSQEVVKKDYSAKAGTEAKSFFLKEEIESKAIIFKESDIKDFVKVLINSDISEDKKIEEENLKINYSLAKIDLEKEKMILNLEVKAKIYSDIDLEKIKKALSGKSFSEVRKLLENHPQIIKTKIKTGPFWRKRVPEDINKIKIKLNLD